MISLKGKKVTVMGLKRSGLSAVHLLLKEGASVVGTDTDPSLRLEARAFDNLPVKFKLGKHDETDFFSSDMIVISPGISAVHPILASAKKREIPVIGELELGSSFLDPRKTYAITGTNRKCTTTELLGEMF